MDTSRVITVADSQTVAPTQLGTSSYLVETSDAIAKTVTVIPRTFKKEYLLTSCEASKSPYFNAVIQEDYCLRLVVGCPDIGKLLASAKEDEWAFMSKSASLSMKSLRISTPR